VGRVLGVKAIVGFHGETVTELRADFETAIDFMIDDCKARGETPEKPASGKLMLRVPPEVQATGKSLNQWAAEILGEAAHL
jgi:predicted HicB family RNase H-like nuclease